MIVKEDFFASEQGGFLIKGWKEAGSQEVQAAITAACAAYGVDCSQAAAGFRAAMIYSRERIQLGNYQGTARIAQHPGEEYYAKFDSPDPPQESANGEFYITQRVLIADWGPADERPRCATKSALLWSRWSVRDGGHMSRRPPARGFIGRNARAAFISTSVLGIRRNLSHALGGHHGASSS